MRKFERAKNFESAKRAERYLCRILFGTLLLIGVFFAPFLSECAIRDYREIPGVTEEEIAAVERLKAERGRFLYGATTTSESFVVDGKPDGFTKLLCLRLGELFGVPFELSVIPFTELISALEDGRIDFTGDLTPTGSRSRYYMMTSHPIAERQVGAFRLKHAEPLDEIARSRTPVYGFQTNTITYDMVRAAVKEPFKARYARTQADMLALIRSGEIDAFLIDSPARSFFGLFDDIREERFFPLIYTPVAIATTQRELSPIVTILDRYLEMDEAREIAEMYVQGERRYRQHRFHESLTEAEKTYLEERIAKRESVPCLFEYTNYPISFYNERERKWQGIAIDVLSEVSRLTGLDFTAANEGTHEWEGLMALLESGQAALISELIYSAERADRFLWADEPYTTDYYALLSRADRDDVTPNEVRYLTVAQIRSSGYSDIFQEWFPEHRRGVAYAAPDEAFAALERGEADLFMASRNMLLYATNYMEKPDFKLAMVFDQQCHSFFGFAKDEEMLREIVSKAQRLIDTKGISNRWKHKVFDYRRKIAAERVPYYAALFAAMSVACLALLALFMKNKKMNATLEATVTERTKALQIQTEAARAASVAKGEFLARMSHEMRTPLNAIMGMSTIAIGSSDPYRKDYCVRRIETASRHLLNVINDILDMSKIESGGLEIARLPFNLRGMIDAVVEMNAYLAEKKQQTILVEIARNVPERIVGDEPHLSQVITNLLSNAIKFSSDGACTHMSVENEGPAEGDGERIRLRFSVRDEGIGIPGDARSKLFESFEQADGGASRRYGGTGLGLPISKKLVELMDGEIRLEEMRGGGACFTFTILASEAGASDVVPVDEPENAQELTDLAKAIQAIGRKHILVVEDIDINREIVATFLEGTYITVDFALDGREAVRKFTENGEKFDLILMDIQMPEMNGYDATMAIRRMRSDKAKRIPIVAMTANVLREDVERCLECGMNDHIGKPVDRALLLRKFVKYFEEAEPDEKNPPPVA